MRVLAFVLKLLATIKDRSDIATLLIDGDYESIGRSLPKESAHYKHPDQFLPAHTASTI
jgi:hypothetical protein